MPWVESKHAILRIRKQKKLFFGKRSPLLSPVRLSLNCLSILHYPNWVFVSRTSSK